MSIELAALDYAALGWHVFPVRGKQPAHDLIRSWQKESTTDPDRIEAWFSGSEGLGIGVDLAKSNLAVIDGDHLDLMPQELLAALDASGAWTHQGQRVRQSWVFSENGTRLRQSAHAWGEVKASGGYIVVAPSPHPSGIHYQWIDRQGVAPVLLPPGIAAMVAKPEQQQETPLEGDTRAFDDLDPVARANVQRWTDATVAGIQSDLLAAQGWSDGQRDASGRGWEKLCADAAYRLARMVLTPWCPLEGATAAKVYRDSCPTDSVWTARDVAEKWASQVGLAKRKGPLPWREDFSGIGIDEEAMFAEMEEDESPKPADPAPPDGMTIEELLDATPTMRHIRDAAISRNRSPLATLVGVLVLVTTAAGEEADYHLPPVVGSTASLNLMAILAGGTGAAKSSTADLAEELVPGAKVFNFPPGTGEGLISAYLGSKKDGDGFLPQVRKAIYVYVDEYEQMAKQADRPGATFLSTLRSMAMGKQVGNGNSDPSKRRLLPAMSYRFGMVIGVQPKLSDGLLNPEQTAAGTPQRFLWCSIRKPNVPLDKRPAFPGPLPWCKPVPLFEEEVPEDCSITYPEDIRNYVVEMDMEETGEEHASHHVLMRLKVAAAMAMLHGRYGHFTHWDWLAAGVLVEHSRETQKECREAIKAERRNANRAAGASYGERQVAAGRVISESLEREAYEALRDVFRKNPGERFNGKALKGMLTSRLRPCRDAALAALLKEGKVRRHPGQRAGSWLWEAS